MCALDVARVRQTRNVCSKILTLSLHCYVNFAIKHYRTHQRLQTWLAITDGLGSILLNSIIRGMKTGRERGCSSPFCITINSDWFWTYDECKYTGWTRRIQTACRIFEMYICIRNSSEMKKNKRYPAERDHNSDFFQPFEWRKKMPKNGHEFVKD